MARAKQPPSDVVTAAQIDAAEAAVRAGGAVALKKLVPAPITRRAEAELIEALVHRGLERTSRVVRVFAEAQLTERIDRGEELRLSGLAKELAGVTGAEAKKAALGLVRAGRAALVKEGRVEKLVPLDGRTLGPNDVARLGSGAAVLKLSIKALEKLLKTTRPTKTRPGLSLPRHVLVGFAEELRALAGSLSAHPTARGGERDPLEPLERDAPRNGEPDDIVMEALRRHRDNLGLVFVPALVVSLASRMGAPSVHAQLLAAAARGEIELRPESGLGRLSPEQRAACVVGPSGRLVSYVRIG